MKETREPDDNGALSRLRAELVQAHEDALEMVERAAASLTGPALADLAERLLRAHARAMARMREQEREAVRDRLER